MSPGTYLLHGLALSSELPLDEPQVERDGDVWARIGAAREVPDEIPEGEVVAELVHGGRRGYTVTEIDDQLRVRFPGLADFVIDHEARTITSHCDSATDPRFISILLPGTVLGIYLSMLGYCVLHASAVEVDGRAVVFAGLSGMGKSTCAALACATGAPLITDDALLIDMADGAVAVPGSSHIRMREQASSILDAFEIEPESWETADGRIAIRPPRITDPIQIAGIVIPRPSRDLDALEMRRIAGPQALPPLLAFARVPGWKKPEIVRSQFHHMGSLVNRVPVFEASIPWGPPFDLEPMREVLQLVTEADVIPP